MDADIEPEDALGDVPRGKLICHSLYTKNKLVFIRFDLETDGERCGIIQISAQIFRINNNEAEVNVFNEYVSPGREAVWSDQACIASHGLSPGHEKNCKCRHI